LGGKKNSKTKQFDGFFFFLFLFPDEIDKSRIKRNTKEMNVIDIILYVETEKLENPPGKRKR